MYSVGRDEKLAFWDGLLGVDWIGELELWADCIALRKADEIARQIKLLRNERPSSARSET